MKRLLVIGLMSLVVLAGCGNPDSDGTQLEKIAELAGHTRSVFRFALSPPYLASLSDDGVRLWNLDTLEPAATITGEANVSHIFFAAGQDQPALVLVRDRQIVELWSVPTGERQRRFEAHPGAIGPAALAPDGVTLALAGQDGQVSIWNIAAEEPLHTLQAHDQPVLAVSFGLASGGELLLATAGMDNKLRLWDPATGEARHTFELPAPPAAIAFSPEGALVAAGAFDTVYVWDTQSNVEKAILKAAPGQVDNVVTFARGEQRMLAAAGTTGVVHLWLLEPGFENDADKEQHATLKEYSLGALALDFSPDGRFIATTSLSEPPRLWQVNNGELIGTMGSDEAPSATIAFAPPPDNGEAQLLVVDAAGTIQVWALKNTASTE